MQEMYYKDKAKTYDKNAIKRVALAIIIQAGEDLHLDDRKKKNHTLRNTAHAFFKSDFCKLCATILEINTIDKIYEEYKKRKIKIQKLYKHKRAYKRRKVII